MAPLEEPLTHDEAHRYARRLVGALLKATRSTISFRRRDRRGRIFLDYLRNGRGTTAIGTYSPRVREGFPTRHLVQHRGRHPARYLLQ